MHDQALIGTKETVSEERFLELVHYIQMENALVESGKIPDKFQICQFLTMWADITEKPIEDLFYILQRTRENLKLQLAKKEQKANRICCEVLGEITQ